MCRKVSERSEGVGTFAFMCGEPSTLKGIFDGIISSGSFIVNRDCPYGDGRASRKILEVLKNEIGGNGR